MFKLGLSFLSPCGVGHDPFRVPGTSNTRVWLSFVNCRDPLFLICQKARPDNHLKGTSLAYHGTNPFGMLGKATNFHPGGALCHYTELLTGAFEWVAPLLY